MKTKGRNPFSDSIDFSKKLKTYRETRGLSMRKAAELIGVSESIYRAWEYGNAIQGEPYLQIAKVFGITLDELFGVSKEESVEEQLNKIVIITQSIRDKISQ